jgi:hypothetical protein
MQLNSRRLLAIAALGGALGTGGVAATAAASTAAASPSHGTVHVWVTPGKGAADQILLTGVIGDHGTATSMDKNGTVDKNGKYVKVALSRGGFVVDAVALNQKLAKLAPKVDSASCTVWASGSGNITLGDGTGAYAGISGTVKMSTNFAAVFPRYTSGAKRGRCDMKGAPTASFQGVLIGSGHITL